MYSFNPQSLRLPNGVLSLDSSGETVFVSHAHSDHVPSLRTCKSLFASQATLDLISARKPSFKHSKHSASSSLLDSTKFYSSGHVLGGQMLLAQGDGASFLYTGDFKTSDSLTVRGAKPVECDELVVETTYGKPGFVFPSREQIYAQIASWVTAKSEKGIIVLGGYSLGKAQDLVKCLNEYAGITPIVFDDIARINEVYVKHGVKLDFIASDSEQAEAEFNKNFVAVLPMHKVTPALAVRLSRHYGKRVYTGVATGWAGTHNYAVDAAFQLTDHCDYSQLMEFVESCAPKRVHCVHGFAKEFAADLRKRGFKAHAQGEQPTLQDYSLNLFEAVKA